MNALAKGDVIVGLAHDVKSLGIRELRWIAISGGDHYEHQGPGRDGYSTELYVCPGMAHRRLHRTVVTKHFFDRARHQFRLVAQERELLGISAQREHAVADEISSGLVAGEQKQDHERQQFISA